MPRTRDAAPPRAAHTHPRAEGHPPRAAPGRAPHGLRGSRRLGWHPERNRPPGGPMKILISADMEGATGVTWPADVLPGTPQWERCRAMFTSDVNAAVLGFYDGGADQVLINEAHWTMRNLLLEKLDARAEMITGRHKTLSMVEGSSTATSTASPSSATTPEPAPKGSSPTPTSPTPSPESGSTGRARARDCSTRTSSPSTESPSSWSPATTSPVSTPPDTPPRP